MDIFEKDLAGFPIDGKDPETAPIIEIIKNAQKILARLNSTHHDEASVREILSELTGRAVPESLWLLPPFYADFGRNIHFGENVFINCGCTFMDRGGIYIGDGVFIAPNVSLVTISHDINPHKRNTTYCKPIHIQNRVWIGIGAIILPSITIGENSIVSAGAVVTKDVPPNTIVAGSPAKGYKGDRTRVNCGIRPPIVIANGCVADAWQSIYRFFTRIQRVTLVLHYRLPRACYAAVRNDGVGRIS